MRTRSILGATVLVTLGCGSSGGSGDDMSASGQSASATASGTATDTATATATGTSGASDSASATSGGSSTSASTSSGGTKFDLGMGTAGAMDMGTPPPSCKVVDGMDAVPDCVEKAPPDAFEPETQWDFMGPPGFEECIVTPLVANMTDDNADGEIDLCDVPDVVIVAGPGGGDTPPSRIYVLDGETGVPHFYTTELVQFAATPALGDIDGDGLVEMVTIGPGAGNLMAFEHDGTLKWQSAQAVPGAQSSAVALADVDADGDVEVIVSNSLYDHDGNLIWTQPGSQIYSASAAADLDGDGQLEILTSNAAYRPNGTQYYIRPEITGWAHPQVADLDDDGAPEVLVATASGFTLLEGDGSVVYPAMAPAGQPGDMNRPINIHNLDGDTDMEFGAADGAHYGIYDANGAIVWTADIVDQSGQAGGTAFDFIGSGVAQAIYADEHTVWVFDDAGATLMDIPHLSGTVLEYPTVADIDNDGSAEIVVVSNTVLLGGQVPFTARAVRDVMDRWVQGRRIWNQHTYHVTNVREDGTIPQVEPKSWELLNTFRTQAQIEGGGLCKPTPEG